MTDNNVVPLFTKPWVPVITEADLTALGKMTRGRRGKVRFTSCWLNHTDEGLPYVVVEDACGDTYHFAPVIKERRWHYADVFQNTCLVTGATVEAICRTLLARAVRGSPREDVIPVLRPVLRAMEA